MEQIASEESLAEIVDRVDGAAAVLERFGLDYCCGGSESLEHACARRGIAPAAVLAAVAASARPLSPAWVALPPGQLVDHIELTHHRYLWAELPRLEALAEKVERAHAERHPELSRLRAAVDELRAELEPHLRKEEECLFPMIRELVASATPPTFHCGSLGNPISVMRSEHERAGELLAELRDMTGGYQPPAGTCATVQALYAGLAALEADTHLHVHKENDRLFPSVLELESAPRPLPG